VNLTRIPSKPDFVEGARLSEKHTGLVHRGIASDMITVDQAELPDGTRRTQVRHGQDR